MKEKDLLYSFNSIEEEILDKNGIVDQINSFAENIKKVAEMVKNSEGVNVLKKALNKCQGIERLNTSELDKTLEKLYKLKKIDSGTFNDVYKPFDENVVTPIDYSILELEKCYELAKEMAVKYTSAISEAENLKSKIESVTSKSKDIKDSYKEIESVIDVLTSD